MHDMLQQACLDASRLQEMNWLLQLAPAILVGMSQPAAARLYDWQANVQTSVLKIVCLVQLAPAIGGYSLNQLAARLYDWQAMLPILRYNVQHSVSEDCLLAVGASYWRVQPQPACSAAV